MRGDTFVYFVCFVVCMTGGMVSSQWMLPRDGCDFFFGASSFRKVAKRRASAGISSPAAVEEFIRLHATANISTNDAARAAGGDIARIKRAYRATYGYSICRGIQEARLREVQRLLRRTQMPIDGIAEMCGFGNGLYLKTLFRSRFGMTMRDYRKAAVRPDAPTPSLP